MPINALLSRMSKLVTRQDSAESTAAGGAGAQDRTGSGGTSSSSRAGAAAEPKPVRQQQQQQHQPQPQQERDSASSSPEERRRKLPGAIATSGQLPTSRDPQQSSPPASPKNSRRRSDNTNSGDSSGQPSLALDTGAAAASRSPSAGSAASRSRSSRDRASSGQTAASANANASAKTPSLAPPDFKLIPATPVEASPTTAQASGSLIKGIRRTQSPLASGRTRQGDTEDHADAQHSQQSSQSTTDDGQEGRRISRNAQDDPGGSRQQDDDDSAPGQANHGDNSDDVQMMEEPEEDQDLRIHSRTDLSDAVDHEDVQMTEEPEGEDDLHCGDIPGIPRSGSPLPMYADDEDDEDHQLRDQAEAQLEAEERERERENAPKDSEQYRRSFQNRPTPLSAFPKRSLLQRLPSQALTDTPSTEASSPGFPSLSRNPSLRGSGVPSRASSGHASPSRQTSSGSQHQSHAPPASASRSATDYSFPSMAGVLTTEEPIGEEEENDDAEARTIKSKGSPPKSISTSTPQKQSSSSSPYFPEREVASSPPTSSGFLDIARNAGLRSPRQAHGATSRQNSSSSQHSNQSVNEYSTPAGFLKHRRNSSIQAPRDVKETLNAKSRDLPDGKRKLNQYVLQRDIGRGSFGVVQIAKDEDTGREYAVKEFSKMRLRKRQQSEMIRRQGRGGAMRRGAVPFKQKPGSSRKDSQGRALTAEADEEPPAVEANDLELIRGEIAVMKKLDHPNVVKLYEVLDVHEDDSLFMVVELCANGPLMTLGMGQHEAPVDEQTARNYFRQIVLAIEYLHCNGIIHRDIKPENILKMLDDNVVKLVDFGVSEMFDKENADDPRDLKTGGSPAFMSPELCVSRHGKVSGKAADIWALGVTLYCLVAGRLPFESNQMLDLYDQIRNDPVKIPEELSDDLKDLLSKLLEKDPEKRIKMPELREHPWTTIDGQDPLPSTDVNVSSVSEITEDDLANAIGTPSVSYIVNAVRAASRWRRYAARRTRSEGGHSNDGSVGSTDAGSTSMSRDNSMDGGPGSTSSPPPSVQQAHQHIRQAVLARSGSLEREPHRSSPLHQNNTPLPGLDTLPESVPDLGIQHAASFPMSNAPNEKGDTVSPGPVKRIQELARGSIVEFPEISSAQSHHDHLSNGIDDCNFETLRHYEDTTGHMLPRSAIQSPPKSRGASPMN